MQFVYFIRPYKENFAETMTEDEANIMGEHFLYLTDMLEKGKLILAGPEFSGKFGIAVIETKTEEEAKELMNNDPAVKSGIVTSEIYPYRVSLIRK